LGIGNTKRQRKQAARLLLVRLLTSASLGVLIVMCFQAYTFLTTTDRLSVTAIEVQGLSRLASTDLEPLLGDIRGQNILLVGLEEYRARFAKHPRIRDVELRKVLPNKVVCTVAEREPVALVYTNEFLEVDQEGMILEPDELSGMLDLPIITGLDAGAVREGRRCDDARLGRVLAVLSYCKSYGGRFAEGISELRVGNKGISIVSLEDGMVLLLGESQLEDRLKRFFMMQNTIAQRDESARLIDLRFEDQIVLRSGI
jgi:cell division protein FtsQ